jgi:hypothetical protein
VYANKQGVAEGQAQNYTKDGRGHAAPLIHRCLWLAALVGEKVGKTETRRRRRIEVTFHTLSNRKSIY